MDKTNPSPPHSLWCRLECSDSRRSNRCGEVERKDITIVGLKGGTQEAAGGALGYREPNGRWKYVRTSTLITVHGHTPDSRSRHICLQGNTSASRSRHLLTDPASTNRPHAYPRTGLTFTHLPMLPQNPAPWLSQLVFLKLRAMTH